MRKCLIAGLSALMILGSAINVYADHQRFKADKRNMDSFDNKAFSWLLNLQNKLTFFKTLAGKITFNYVSKNNWGPQLYPANWQLDAGLRQLILKRRGNVKADCK